MVVGVNDHYLAGSWLGRVRGAERERERDGGGGSPRFPVRDKNLENKSNNDIRYAATPVTSNLKRSHSPKYFSTEKSAARAVTAESAHPSTKSVLKERIKRKV